MSFLTGMSLKTIYTYKEMPYRHSVSIIELHQSSLSSDFNLSKEH